MTLTLQNNPKGKTVMP